MTENITIRQGETYYFPPFEIDGNWTGGVCRGQIRDDYKYLDGSVLAYLQFETLTYDPATEKTTVKPYIDHQFTSSIPPHPKWKRGSILSEKNAYLLDIEIEKDGVVTKTDTNLVEIIPEVTDNSIVVDPPIIWDGSIDRVELTEANGLIKTYTVWGTPNETVNLGTFDVTDGQKGDKGDQGDQGDQGISGEKGDRGDQGDQGIQGVQGVKGNDGLSAYQIAVNDGFVGSESQWRESLKADLDAPTIKSRYESNANTNAFTDTEKAKLANLETTLSAKADLIGGVIPNSQIPSIAITEFLGEVADESEMLLLIGEKGDWAIRSDTNSTWILTGNNPSSLNNWVEIVTPSSGVGSVNGYQGVVVLTYSDVGAASSAQGTKADTALQHGDIGVSVQSYNANTVIDALYLRTDNNYTNTEKTKLAGIESGAQVNVRSDWNATSGDAQILNKPTLGTAAATDTSSYATAAQGAKADTALQPRQKNVVSVNSTVNLTLSSVYYQFYTPTVASVDVICPVLTSDDNFEIEIFNKHETNALVIKDSASNILGTLSPTSITEDRGCRLFWDGTDLHYLPLGGY
jgi:hypothetical protein